MTTTETKGERKKATTTKQNASNSSYLVQEVTPQILSLGTKPFVIFKKWFNRFSVVREWKSIFYCQLEVNINHLYSFGHKEKVDLFVCFALSNAIEQLECFLICLPN